MKRILLFGIVIYLIFGCFYDSTKDEQKYQEVVKAHYLNVKELYAKKATYKEIRKYVESITMGINYCYMMDHDGVFIIHPKMERRSYKTIKHPVPFLEEALAKRTGVVKYTWDGEDKLLVFHDIPEVKHVFMCAAYIRDLRNMKY